MLCIQLLLRTLFNLQNKQGALQKSGQQGGKARVCSIWYGARCSAVDSRYQTKEPTAVSAKAWSPFSAWSLSKPYRSEFIFNENKIQDGRKNTLPCISLETQIN